MARLLAVDWDRHEARYVLAGAGGDSLKILSAGSISLVDVAEGGNAPHPDIGGSLRAALADEKANRAIALVGVERASIELLHFTLPPARDEELPELVANQAIRESPLVTEQSLLDFMPSGVETGGPREVTAAVLSREQLKRIQQTCETAGLKPKRLLLRPYASASLFCRLVTEPERVCLLINPVAEEVDLSFLIDGKPAFFRTVRLPAIADPEKATERLLMEINRTLVVAAQSQLGEETVDRVYVFGGTGEHDGLADQIRDRLSLPVEVIDPFDAVDAGGRPVPEGAGRFASLLGMLLDEASGSPHAIDFLHPRRQPEPPNRRRLFARLAALAGLAALVAAYFIWTTLADLDVEIGLRQNRLRDLDGLMKRAAQQQRLVAAVRGWQASDVTWLDELRDLSLRFPSERDMVVLRMSMSAGGRGGGAITLNGLVRAPSIVARMERNVRDGYHRISSKRIQERVQEKSYTWHFESSISVARRHKSQYVSHLPGWQIGGPPIGGQGVAMTGTAAPGSPQGTLPITEPQQASEP